MLYNSGYVPEITERLVFLMSFTLSTTGGFSETTQNKFVYLQSDLFYELQPGEILKSNICQQTLSFYIHQFRSFMISPMSGLRESEGPDIIHPVGTSVISV